MALFSSGSLLDEKINGISSLESTYSPILDEESGHFSPSYITGCRFDGNTATNGGAIYTTAGYDVVVKSSFTRNFAGGYWA